MNGFAAVLKPPGIGSQTLVTRLRRRHGLPELGHAGTLDPAAAGVLLVVDGFARRLVDVAAFPKAYRAEIWLGLTTDSDDLEGTVLAERDASHLTEHEVEEALAAFRGVIRQVPPARSAVHVGGVRAYVRARRGEAVAPAARTVEVAELQLKTFIPGRLARVRVHTLVSAGTYVRSLARDVGAILGVGGCLAALLRTAVGPFGLASAALPDGPLHFVDAAHVLPFPRLGLSAEEWRRVRTGQPILGDEVGPVIAVHGGETVALLEGRDGRLWPRRVQGEGRP